MKSTVIVSLDRDHFGNVAQTSIAFNSEGTINAHVESMPYRKWHSDYFMRLRGPASFVSGVAYFQVTTRDISRFMLEVRCDSAAL